MVGSKVPDGVGSGVVGDAVGTNDGVIEGIAEGASVGRRVGRTLGTDEGAKLGVTDGISLGSSVRLRATGTEIVAEGKSPTGARKKSSSPIAGSVRPLEESASTMVGAAVGLFTGDGVGILVGG
jgi:hypothetical protein